MSHATHDIIKPIDETTGCLRVPVFSVKRKIKAPIIKLVSGLHFNKKLKVTGAVCPVDSVILQSPA